MRKIVFMVLSMILFVAMTGCSTAATTSQKLEVNWPFYKVEKDGKYMYVLGTIHTGKERMYPFPTEIMDAMKKSKYLVTEIDMSDDAMKQTSQKIKEIGTLPNGKLINDLLSEDAKKHLKEVSKEYGIDENQLQSYRPFLLSTILLGKVMNQNGLSPMFGVDSELTSLSNTLHMDKKALESATFQIEQLAKSIPDEDANKIVLSIPSLADQTKILSTMFDKYVKGEAGNEVVNGLDDKMTENLLRVRNDNWIPELESYIASGDVHFVACGAAHLSGNIGILEQLKAKGYTVTKVEIK